MVVARRPPKMKALMGTPAGSSHAAIDRRALRCRRGEAAIGMRRLGSGLLGDLRCPALAAPVDAFGGRFIGHSLPPHAAVRRQRHVGEDCVPAQGRHRVGIGLVAGARRHAEEPRLGIDGAQLAVRVGRDPGDVVADRRHLPAARTPSGGTSIARLVLPQADGKRRRDIGLLALRRLDAEDQHVLGHPALVAGDVRGDAQREALLAQQCVAAVTRAVAPDLARLGKMHDVLRRRCRARARPSALRPAARPPNACRAPRAWRRGRSRPAPAGRSAS